MELPDRRSGAARPPHRRQRPGIRHRHWHRRHHGSRRRNWNGEVLLSRPIRYVLWKVGDSWADGSLMTDDERTARTDQLCSVFLLGLFVYAVARPVSSCRVLRSASSYSTPAYPVATLSCGRVLFLHIRRRKHAFVARDFSSHMFLLPLGFVLPSNLCYYCYYYSCYYQ